MSSVDVLVVGGGILGLATARELKLRAPSLALRLIEARAELAQGQSGHNSGVLHSGIYYRPGSLKARLCRAGRAAMLDFCRDRDIAVRVDGKLLVATRDVEVERLDALLERGRENGLEGLRRLSVAEVHAREPEIAAVEAALVPEAGVLDYRDVCRALAEESRELGVELCREAPLEEVRIDDRGLAVRCGGREMRTHHLLSCAGLYSDRVARLAGARPSATVIPFRGEYCSITPADRVRALVYPVPDPTLPFLGVHLTRGIDGELHAGPNAVLAFSREGYRWQDIDARDTLEVLGNGAFWKLARRHWRSGRDEMHRSLVRTKFVAEARRLLPSLRESELRPSSAGVRAQLLDSKGQLVDDFLFADSPHAMHVLNAPSPAATASLAIASEIADRAGRAGWY
jgi:(S)-2-hydroxyglutarate dehydrogenase